MVGDKTKLFLIIILIIGSFLRLWNLSSNPPHLTSDEAALGYNAYSILKTSRDEHGRFLPVIFESFGDWKPGLYIYLTVPFVLLLGLTEWTVRLPSALIGIVSIFAIFKLGEEIGYFLGLDERRRGQIGLFSALFLAISPWHIQFSRGGWEANVSFGFTLFALFFFLSSIRGNQKRILLSALFFGLTLLIYQGAKLATLVVLVGLVLVFWQKVIAIQKKLLIQGIFIGAIFAFPILLSLLNGKAGRLSVFSIFSYPRSQPDIARILEEGREEKGDLTFILFHSEPLHFARGIIGRLFNHFSPRFLFFEGDWASRRHNPPDTGMFYIADIFLLIAGFVFLSQQKNKRIAIFLWFWLFLSPLPAALSRDSVHGVRSLNMIGPTILLLGFGAFFLKERFSSWKAKKIFIFVLILIYIGNFVYWFDQYWIHYPIRNADAWQYGYKQLVTKITPIQKNYKQIIVQQDYSQPYIFFLFYQKYNPSDYQKISKEVFVPSPYGDVGLVKRLDNIVFREINWTADRGLKGTLFAGDSFKIPDKDIDGKKQKIIDEVKLFNGVVKFKLVEVN